MAQTILVDGTPIGYLPNGNASDVEYDNTQSGLTATNTQDAIDELNADLTVLNSARTWKMVANFNANETANWLTSITNMEEFKVDLLINGVERQTILICTRTAMESINGVFPDFMTSDGRVYAQIFANDSQYTVSSLTGLSTVSDSATLAIYGR